MEKIDYDKIIQRTNAEHERRHAALAQLLNDNNRALLDMLDIFKRQTIKSRKELLTLGANPYHYSSFGYPYFGLFVQESVTLTIKLNNLVYSTTLLPGINPLMLEDGAELSTDTNAQVLAVWSGIPMGMITGNTITGNTTLAGRNASKLNLFNGLAITDTAAHFSQNFNTKESAKMLLIVTNTLDQAVTLRAQMPITNVVAAAGGDIQVSISSKPQGQKIIITSTDFAILGQPIYDDWRLFVTASVAPTSGTFSMDLIKLPN